tara:strand:+ start:74 stop:814 length:741 start_codon:yes stop_codon:yes gene_type:complete
MTIFTRIGRKTPLKEIIKKYTPDNYNLYVEPFVGSGAIYLDQDLDGKKAIINDKDKTLMDAWKAIKKGITIDESTYNFPLTAVQQEKYYKSLAKNDTESFLIQIIKQGGTFRGKGTGKIYEPVSISSFKNKVKKAKELKEYMKDTRLFSSDYNAILKKFDGVNTFFYLDPPYENSKGIYEHAEMNFNELKKILTTLRGKFLLSLNDSPNIRKEFNNFKQVSVKVKGGNATTGIASGDRKELLIMNY